MSEPTYPETDQLNDKIVQARALYRRGYSIIDAAGNAGLHVDVLDRYLTDNDHAVHAGVWGE